MKKLLAIVLAALMCVALVSCNTNSSNGQAQSMGGYILPTYEMITQTGEENGLIGTKIYIVGTATDMTIDGGYPTLHISTAEAEWVVGISDYDLLDGSEVSEIVGKEVVCYGGYNGRSMKYDKPSMILDTLMCDGKTLYMYIYWGDCTAFMDGIDSEQFRSWDAIIDYLDAVDGEVEKENADSINEEQDSSEATKTTDFFDDKDRTTEFMNLLDNLDFTGIKEYVEKYIDDNSPDSSDSAFKILETIEPVFDIIQECEIIYDDFDESYTMQYPEVTKIGKSVCVVPKLTRSKLEVTFGFRKSGWLFFDKLELKCPQGEIKDMNCKYDTERDVVSGSTIEEFYIAGYSYGVPEEFTYDGDFTVRFTNSDTRDTYVHDLSESEVKALTYLSRINLIIEKLDDIRLES